MSVEINNCLKVWRAKLSLAHAELTEKIEVSRKTINTLERGIYTPSINLALKIANFFDTQVEEVFTLKPRYIFQRNT